MKKIPTPALLGLLVASPVFMLWVCHRWPGERTPTPLPRVSAGTGFPVRVTVPGNEELVLEEPPLRVLPANAGLFDYVSLLVGPERVVALPQAVGDYARPEANIGGWAELPRFAGYEAETILGHAPDLVLAHGWQKVETTALVRENGIPVLVLPLPKTWADVRGTLTLLGRVLGAEERAREVDEETETRLRELRRRRGATGLTALSYSNLGAGGSAAGRGTTADILFELAGLENAAAKLGLQGHEALDLEALLALDPDLIVVGAAASSDGRAPSAEYLYGEGMLVDLRAVRERRVIVLPPRLFTTSSLELLAGAERLADEVARLFPEILAEETGEEAQ